MRVGILGSWDSRYRAENDWQTALEAHGLTVVPMHGPSASPRQVIRLARSVDVLMWVTMGRGWPRNLAQQASRFCHTVGWRPDRYHGRNLVNWQADPIWGCERVFTTDGWAGNDWGVIRHRFMEQAVNADYVRRKGRRRAAFECDVAFVGQVDRYPVPEWTYRRELVEQLRGMCDRNGWTFLNPGGAHRRIERGPRMNDFYRTARVTVGDSILFHGVQDCYWSNRLPEALGRGGVLVWPENEPVRSRVGDWLPMYRMGDWQQLEDTVARLLASPNDNAYLRGQGKEWAKAHTYERRVPVLLEGWL